MRTGIIVGLMVGIIGILVYAGNAEAAVDMFLKIDSIPGESTDDSHMDWIDVLSMNWGATNTGTTNTGSKDGAGIVSVQDFNFAKEVDKSSPKLFLAVANGQSIRDVQFDLTKSFDLKVMPILNFKFTGAIVTSYAISASAGDDTVPIENISLNFQKVEYTHSQFDEKGGSKGDVKVSWDIVTNEGG